MKKIKVMTVFGTRKETIKMAPLVLELQKQSQRFEAITTVSAQHRKMLDQVLDIFHIKPDYDLNIMHARQTLTDITSNVLINLDKILKEAKPDIVLVHRSEEHTSELQSRFDFVCRLLLEQQTTR